MTITERIDELISLTEKGKIGWEEYPEGWKKKSVKKMGKTLTGLDPKEKGFFDR